MPEEQLTSIYALDEQFYEIKEFDSSNFEPKVFESIIDLPAQTFEGWANVPADYKSIQDWQTNGRRVAAEEKSSARVRTTWTRRSESMDIDVPVEKFHALFHESQTRPIRQTELSKARQKFYTSFAEPANWKRLIRWTQGEWKYPEDGEKYWDDKADKWRWRTFSEKLTLPKLTDHELGREIYGIFGGKNSYHLVIDLDLHNQPLDTFKMRLERLLNRFHGQHGCHFQVSNANAGGIHLILYFGTAGLLATRRTWLLKVLIELDQADPGGKFTKQVSGVPKFNIEVYPDPNKPIRLPLARQRIMLLDRPLEPAIRRGKQYQDVVGYVNWLTTKPADRGYMAKEDVIKFVMDRLDLSKSKDNQLSMQDIDVVTSQKRVTFKPKAPTFEKANLKGKTKSAIIGYWQDGKSTFPHLNSAILTTLQALHAQKVSQLEAVNILTGFCDDLPNKQQLSSRFVAGMPQVLKEISRQADKAWQTPPNEKWKQSAEHWLSYGFLVADKSTWRKTRQSKLEEIIVDSVDLICTEEERGLVNKFIAPLVLGSKQATKPEKQEEVIRAVNYFLCYVNCCTREIPYKAVSSILSKFNINFGQDHKKSKFISSLVRLNWICVKNEYFCPALHGLNEKGRARSYVLGPGMECKLSGSKQEKNNKQNKDLLSVLHFSVGEQGQLQCVSLSACRTDQDAYLAALFASVEEDWGTSSA